MNSRLLFLSSNKYQKMNDERFRPSQFWWNFTNEYDAPNSGMKAGKQRNEAGVSSTKQSVIVHAETRGQNEAEQPAAIFVGYSVISSIQWTGPVFDPAALCFQPADALLLFS